MISTKRKMRAIYIQRLMDSSRFGGADEFRDLSQIISITSWGLNRPDLISALFKKYLTSFVLMLLKII